MSEVPQALHPAVHASLPEAEVRAKRTFSDEAWAFERVERAVQLYPSHAALPREKLTIYFLRFWLREKAAAYRALAKKAEGSGRAR